MPLYPAGSALYDVFRSHHPLTATRPSKAQFHSRPAFTAWSVAEDTKDKASQLGHEAAVEIRKASEKAQAKTGHIELYSAKYYAACTFGGLIACVGIRGC